MKAAWFDRYGPPEVLTIRDVPLREPGPDEIRIRQAATNVSPADCAMRSANPPMVRLFTGLLKPKAGVPGETIAGTVDAVGSAVTAFKPGDRVFGITDLAMGALAEVIVVPANSALTRMPDTLSFDEAGGLPYSTLTALPFLRDEAKLQPEQRILINGAAGSIGTVAVQMARNMGAHVTAVCSARNVDLVLSLGADEVIDRGKIDFTTSRGAYDVIFDTVGKSNFAACEAALKPGGIYLTTVPSWAIAIKMLFGNGTGKKRGKLATTGLRKAPDKKRDMELIAVMIARGELRGIIDRIFRLEQIAEAHRYVERGTKAGDAIITFG